MSMYDLIAEAFNDAPESFRFNRVYEQVQGGTGQEIADCKMRVASRFFTHVVAWSTRVPVSPKT